ncbi:RBBP9/YdeN family alpha/beta hydrolase [Alkanindiges sp. WGS2144]|uniref:RBBP9/YdeN family alpha/beta hydrolase n=1 Tax=Alkanindiges sp. WGS2144 TaxID=3366808 RepID=UPI0037526B79
MANHQVYIIHGYGASPAHHWFPWLAQQLKQQDIQVAIPALPAPEHPVKEEWDQYLQSTIGIPNEQTYFVAHSLGCIALLDYLQQLEPLPHIGGLILVSGFSCAVPGYSLINPFIAHALKADSIISMAPRRLVIAARNDHTVPYELTEQLASSLEASFVLLEQGGHFLGSDDCTSFELVYEQLKKMLTTSAMDQVNDQMIS